MSDWLHHGNAGRHGARNVSNKGKSLSPFGRAASTSGSPLGSISPHRYKTPSPLVSPSATREFVFPSETSSPRYRSGRRKSKTSDAVVEVSKLQQQSGKPQGSSPRTRNRQEPMKPSVNKVQDPAEYDTKYVPRGKKPLLRRHSSPGLLTLPSLTSPSSVGSSRVQETIKERPASSVQDWLRGSDRPKTSKRGVKPLYGAKSQGGQTNFGRAKTNQDNFFLYHKEGENDTDFIAAVMDGHGQHGHHVSSFVKSALAPQLLHQKYVKQQDVAEAASQAFVNTAQALDRTGLDVRQSGTTAVACVRQGDKLIVANAGDSRCVLGRYLDNGRYKAVPLTTDHKPSMKSETERIRRAGGYVEPSHVPGHGFLGPQRVWNRPQQSGGLAVSRSIGDTNLTKAGVIPVPDVIERPVSPRDRFVVMASDGVWDCLSNDEVIQIAASESDPRIASSSIVKKARERWVEEGTYIDDITALVVQIAPPNKS